MHLPTLLLLALPLLGADAALTWRLQKAASPTADQTSAYAAITAAMNKAVARYNRLTTRPSKSITASYVPGVQTADGNFNGNIRFGSNRAYMTERTALHEIAHTLGVGQTAAFDAKCKSGDWPGALKLLRGWDGSSAKINCGGGHFWPYGLNYETEMSETNAERHCKLVDAMLGDGLAG